MRTNKIGRIGEGKAEHFILSLFTSTGTSFENVEKYN